MRIDNVVLATIFGGLAAISAGIYFSYTNLLKDFYNLPVYILVILTITMWFILFRMSPYYDHIKIWYENKKKNRIAQRLFGEFEDKGFVGSFKRFIGIDNVNTFQDIIETRLKESTEFNDLNSIKTSSIKDRIYFWLNRYTYFRNKIDYRNFTILLKEFSNMVEEYRQTCVEEPIKQIKDMIVIKNTNINIKGDIKKDWELILGNYNIFVRDYNQFVERVNFGVSKLPDIDIPIVKLLAMEMGINVENKTTEQVIDEIRSKIKCNK